jgi:hypothetical protein
LLDDAPEKFGSGGEPLDRHAFVGAAAEAAAKEFLRSPKLPASIEWTEL